MTTILSYYFLNKTFFYLKIRYKNLFFQNLIVNGGHDIGYEINNTIDNIILLVLPLHIILVRIRHCKKLYVNKH